MDIHKPKAAHSIREFLIEIGTIICGILIALGLEQVATAIHERRIADEARESVRAEVRENLWWIERREGREACVNQKLGEIGLVLGHARHAQPFEVPRQVELPVHAKLTTLRWEANSQAGRASLFTPTEQRYLGNMYFSMDEFRRAQDRETEVWSKLGAMENLDHFTSNQLDEFGVFLAQARYLNGRVALSSQRAHQWAERMHVVAESSDNPGIQPVGGQIRCLPIGTARSPDGTAR